MLLICRSHEDDGERRKKEKRFQFGHAELPGYTTLDAVGWVGLQLLCGIKIHFPIFGANLSKVGLP